MKLMISQPMNGKTTEEITFERGKIISILAQEGHEVIETVFCNNEEYKNIPVAYLAKSIDAMANVDGVVFMPGWANARGCRIEYQIAKEYGKFIKEVK